MNSQLGRILLNYLQLAAQRAGVRWQDDYSAEITSACDAMETSVDDHERRIGALESRIKQRDTNPRLPLYAVRVGPWHLTPDGRQVKYGMAPEHRFGAFNSHVKFISIRVADATYQPQVVIGTYGGEQFELLDAERGPAEWRLSPITPEEES